MKIYRDIDQGSGDWYQLRVGIPTASEFHHIITPAKAEYSKSARMYAYRLISERLLNRPTQSAIETEWMARGKDLEPIAAGQYEVVNDVELERVGFVTTDDGSTGASPDRIIKGKGAGLEIKIPAPHVHMGYLLGETPDIYRPQVQGQNYVCEFDYVDLYSYCERMPAATIRSGRDEPYIQKIKVALDQFNADLIKMLDRAKSLGVFQAYEHIVTPHEQEEADELGAAYREEMLYPLEGAFR